LKRTLPVNFLAALDGTLQWTGKFVQFTPSVFVATHAIGGGLQTKSDSLFACPACGSALRNTPPLFTCPNCGHTFPVADGIYDFRLAPPAE
jgi:predicted RNA-binding Zn-ribbon protein involved in translation (DUF1610 family)